MKYTSALIALLFFLITENFVSAQGLTAKEIVKKSDEKTRGLSSQGEMTMTIVRPSWNRTLGFKTWSKGVEYSMVLITSPAKEAGQVFMRRKKEMWDWVPSINKLIKIPPSMMMQSWMGSDFTNDDLTKESSIVADYDHKLICEENSGNDKCYKIELLPLPDAPVTWGKIIMWISVKGYDQLRAEYYDEDMKLVNIMTASEIKKFGDIEIPSKLEISPQDKKGSKTILEIKSMIFNKPLQDTFFSQQNMKAVR